MFSQCPIISGSEEDHGFDVSANFGVYAMDKMVLDDGPYPHATPSGPYFDPEFTKNISVVTGGKAVLNCRVYNIGNRTVWEFSIQELTFTLN